MPVSWRRRRATTSSADCFSATNIMVLPVARARKIRLATVWDLPVPGGPSTTRLCPVTASATTRAWVASAVRGRSSTTASRPGSLAGTPAGSAKSCPGASMRWDTSGLAARVRQESSRSCHIR